jgi:hypothetical protein
MFTIFIEYKLHEFSKLNYKRDIALVSNQLKKEKGIVKHQLLEATDQNDLMVETIYIHSRELYDTWKDMLQSDDPSFPWHPILKYVIGGKKKFNMWAFTELPLTSASSFRI